MENFCRSYHSTKERDDFKGAKFPPGLVVCDMFYFFTLQAFIYFYFIGIYLTEMISVSAVMIFVQIILQRVYHNVTERTKKLPAWAKLINKLLWRCWKKKMATPNSAIPGNNRLPIELPMHALVRYVCSRIQNMFSIYNMCSVVL